MLIRNAEIMGTGVADLRIGDGKITEIGRLAADPDETTIEAGGHALLPGLHDHHIHFLAFAASFNSLRCGPPQVVTAKDLVQSLRTANASLAPSEWIRGIGYHESVAGEIDREWLDRVVSDRPVRIQHRGGRLWIMNSLALALLGSNDDEKLERVNGTITGRLYDGDVWLRQRLGNRPPALGPASRYLASRGVTGFTDATPTNAAEEIAIFKAAIDSGNLIQRVLMMGSEGLSDVEPECGATKIHLREAVLPPIDTMIARIVHSHTIRRPVAVHCVTLAELIFSLAAFQDANTIAGDRIEHAGVTPPDALPLIARLGLTVVTQPNFIAERGDVYVRDVDPSDHSSLYRLRAFLDAGIPLGGGTDAPFGGPDPWAAMAAAVSRRSKNGQTLGPHEALTPEQALMLFLGDLRSPGGPARTIRVGINADICLIDRPWAVARRDLGATAVTMTVKAGDIVWRSEA